MDDLDASWRPELSHAQHEIGRLSASNEALTRENGQLQRQLELAQRKLSKLESLSSRADEEHRQMQIRIDDLASQLRLSASEAKSQARQAEHANHAERERLLGHIAQLHDELKIAKQSAQELNALYVARERECIDTEKRCQEQLEICGDDAHRTLAAAGSYFHTLFPSLASLEDHFAAKAQLSLHAHDSVGIGAKPARLRHSQGDAVGAARRHSTQARRRRHSVRWTDVAITGLPGDVADSLAKVVENDSLSTATKYRHIVRTLVRFYEGARVARRGEAPRLLETLALETLSKAIDAAEIASNSSIQGEIVAAIQQLKSDLRESRADNHRLQRSFAGEKLATLRATVAEQKRRIDEQNVEIIELTQRAAKPQSDIREMRGSQFYSDELKAVRESLREQEHLKATIARQSLKIEQLERELREKEAKEHLTMSSRLSGLQQQHDGAQGQLSALREQLETSQHSQEHIASENRQLHHERESLRQQLEAERAAFLRRLKDAKMDTIGEYDTLVNQLKLRCSEQKATIEALLAQLKARTRK